MMEKTYDLVVIGGGGAGLAAACRAAELGSSVLVLEKRPYYGGNTGMAGGWIFGVESRIQKENGSRKSSRDVFNMGVDYHHYERLNLELYWNIIKRSGATMDWLEGLGAEYRADGDMCHMPTKIDSDFGYFRNYVELMAEHMRELNGEIRTNAAVDRIVTENGAVSAVEYTDAATGEKTTVKTGAVVISTGGFMGNDELLCKYFPDTYEPGTYLTDAIPLEGDGIGLAEGAGAKLNDYCCMCKEPNYSFMRRNKVPNRISGLHFCVWVNREGKRYCAEDVAGRNGMTNILVAQPGKVGYALFDNTMLEELAAGRRQFPMAAMLDTSKIPDYLRSESRKWVCISEDWDEIAAWMGAKPEVLRRTVEEYNRFCENGEDEAFGKSADELVPLKDGPFYAVKFCPLIIDTFGPVVTDREMRVIGRDDKPVAGLYAAGVIVAGLQGRDYYISGANLGFALGTGLLAGETAVKDGKQVGN
ncbi:MAG: FAD-dependent oxidoreductase [Oscillospiraceae bacterium]